MKVLSVILVYFIQPLFWLGLIRGYCNHARRLKRTRHAFNSSVTSRDYEVRHFFVGTLGIGLLLSLLAWATELTLPLSWIWGYEGMMLVSLLIPWMTLAVTLTAVWAGLGLGLHLSSEVPGQNYVLLMSALILGLSLWIGLNGGRYNVPRCYHNRRGTLIAGYPFKELTVAPMLLMVPGPSFHQLLPFCVTFNLGGRQTGILLLPIVIGLRWTVFKHVPRLIFKKLGLKLMVVGLSGLLLAEVSHLAANPAVTLVSLLVVLGMFWSVLWMAKHFDLHHGQWVSQTVNGLRVVGVEPHTPASKMDLQAGDVILNVNQQRVNNEDEFYRALQSHPTYCHLRVLNLHHRIIITGTAIFDNAPHDVGVIPFRKS